MATVALLTVELHIGDAQSLKDKRMTVRAIKDRLRKFNVAVAEIEYQDLWQRAALGVVTIGTSHDLVDQTFAAVVEEIERVAPGLTTRTQVEFLT